MQPTPFENAAATLPCVGGLIAGTLALMTCWAAPESSTCASEEQQRRLMARKIASNLYFLREHPDVAPGLRQVIGKVHERWVRLAHGLSTGNGHPSDHAPAACTAATNALH
jgi:hypothetical protein